MSSANTYIPSPDIDNTEFHIYDVPVVLIAEICTYLGVHDQVNMKSVCKWWRTTLSAAFLSRLVDIDCTRMLDQSEDFLEHTLSTYIQKNTKILVLRKVPPTRNSCGIVARVVMQKHADLTQITLKDCEVGTEFAAAAYYWTHPEHIGPFMWHGLISATKKLVLENYTIHDALGVALSWCSRSMPCDIAIKRNRRIRNLFQKVPVFLTRCEFDRSNPLQQHYSSFITALNSSCPEVSPESRKDVMLLYNSWILSDATERQWLSVGNLIKCLQEGVPVTFVDVDVNVSALRQLDPLTLNKLCVHLLHRLYF